MYANLKPSLFSGKQLNITTKTVPKILYIDFSLFIQKKILKKEEQNVVWESIQID
jgi:hypothetical protein